MSPELTLVLACFGLGLVITYAWWAATRVTLLRCDLRAIRDGLDAAMFRKGMSADPGYQLTRTMIDWLIAEAPYLSLPVLVLAGVLRPRPKVTPSVSADAPRVATHSDGLTDEVAEAKLKASLRVLSFLAASPSNVVVLVLAQALGRVNWLGAQLVARRDDLRILDRLATLFP